MQCTVYDSLKKDKYTVIVITDRYDPRDWGETKKEKDYIYQILTGVTPYVAQNMYPLDMVKYANELPIGIHLITNHMLLYAINNRILAHVVKDNIPEGEKEIVPPLDPKEISIFEAKDGKVYPIQDEDGMVRENTYDRIMKNIMADFHNLLNYYEPE